jgi:hypothetical protein
MAKIARKDMEEPKTLQEANKTIGDLESDSGMSKELFYSKWDDRVVKVLLYEYLPLLLLAEERQSQEHWYVRSIHLSQDSNKGEDGEIRFWGHRPSKVQITRANMNYKTELMIEHMKANKCCGYPLQEEEYERIKSKGNIPKHVKPPDKTRILGVPDPVFQKTLETILCRIEEKERNYHSGTDTLIVVSGRYWSYLKKRGLHEAICQEVTNRPESSYKRIYILYGNEPRKTELKRVK